jgi:hypothetical protein
MKSPLGRIGNSYLNGDIMSDRVQQLTVILDKEYRLEDDAQKIIEALSMVKGVRKVTAERIMDIADYAARQTVLHDFRSTLFTLLSLVDEPEAWREIEAVVTKAKKKRGY